MAGRARPKPTQPTPLLEWVAAAVGLVLAIGIIALIGREAMKGGSDAPPAVTARVERIVPTAAGFVVEVELRNLSPTTAAAVEVEGELKQAGQTVASSRAMVDYVPGESRRSAGLFFREDPRRQQLEVRALGYVTP